MIRCANDWLDLGWRQIISRTEMTGTLRSQVTECQQSLDSRWNYQGLTGAMIFEACCVFTCNVFFATTAFAGKSMVSGSPVLGFGS
jgi:hypothetical protein